MPHEAPCPVCSYEFEIATALSGNRPEVGDYVICFDCGTILVFQANLRLKIASDAEMKRLPPTVTNKFLDVKRVAVMLRQINESNHKQHLQMERVA